MIYLKHVDRAEKRTSREEEDMKFGAPTVLTPLRDVTVNEGERARFEAKISPVGDPSMRVEWFFNGKSVAASMHQSVPVQVHLHTLLEKKFTCVCSTLGSRVNYINQFGYVALEMLGTATHDVGEYTCELKNAAGAARTSARLTVNARRELESEMAARQQTLKHTETHREQQKVAEKEPLPSPPKFVRQLQDAPAAAEGVSVHLEAQVTPTSDHTMRIEWTKDGAPITASSRIGTIFSFGYVSLNITNLRMEDSGTYKCRAVNAAGEATTQARISVKATTDMTTSTGIVEQQQYIQQTTLLEQQQQAKANLQRTESIVEPTQAPEFKTPIKDQVGIKEGGFAHFEARLEPMGDHTMTVEWFKDGRPVDASSRITTFFNFGYVALTIKQVGSYDAGTYTCVAKNKCGRAETAARMTTTTVQDADVQSKTWESIQQMEATKKMTATTTIVPQEETTAPRFLSQLKGTGVVLEGQRAHFECRLEPQNDPNLKVQWLHDGRELKASSRIQTYHDFGYVALDILDATKEDSGKYTLIAQNTLGREEASVNLRVDPHGQGVDSSTIHHKAIEETKRFEIKQEKVMEEIPLTQQRPVFRTTLVDPQPVMEGQNIHLEARLEPIGDPTMKVEWFFNNSPLTIGSRFRTYNDFGFIALDIVGVTTHDQGQYVCRATNALGSADTHANVKVISRSSVVTDSEHEAAMQQINYLEQKPLQAPLEDEAVRQPPSFTKSLKSVEATEGNNVHLEARLMPTGDSTMRLEWTVNGVPLKTGQLTFPLYMLILYVRILY